MTIRARQMLVSPSKHSLKCPNVMTAEYITYHETANDASANNEISFMINNNNSTGYHYAADDKEVVQGIPINRNAWHCGDGANGTGNRKSIGVEVCYSRSGGERFNKARELGIKFIAQLLHERNWNVNRLKKHQDWNGKYCPHRTLSEGNWNYVVRRVEEELNKLKNGVSSSSPAKPSNSQPAQSTVIKNGDRGDAVKSLQERLNSIGYDCGIADGIFGNATDTAVKHFQRDKGLIVDGIVGQNTLDAITKEENLMKEKIEKLEKELAELKKMITEGNAATPSPWAKDVWDNSVYFDKARPQAMISRQETALVVNRVIANTRKYITDPLEERIAELEKQVK
ncbi:peptidoglycan recognition protein family protein [Alkalihalophilus pseudofirmus]|uniref:peptidoglycan recognition protein family protein n=1 Tax=Alkalihalophilus pseudofirmus TaxID=79885 RepID=UPI00338E498B